MVYELMTIKIGARGVNGLYLLSDKCNAYFFGKFFFENSSFYVLLNSTNVDLKIAADETLINSALILRVEKCMKHHGARCDHAAEVSVAA